MEYVIIVVLVIAIIFLLRWLIKHGGKSKKSQNIRKAAETAARAKKEGLLVNCPLCNSPLLPGEDLVTRVYRPMNVPDQLCTINGCPHCYPVPEPGIKRECPVCHKDVPIKDGHLIARLFNKTTGKKHVIVTGCTECSKGAK